MRLNQNEIRDLTESLTRHGTGQVSEMDVREMMQEVSRAEEWEYDDEDVEVVMRRLNEMAQETEL